MPSFKSNSPEGISRWYLAQSVRTNDQLGFRLRLARDGLPPDQEVARKIETLMRTTWAEVEALLDPRTSPPKPPTPAP